MMTDSSATGNEAPTDELSGSSARGWLVKAVSAALVLIIFTIAGAVSYYWLTHRPMAQRRPPAPQAALVEVIPIQAETARVVVSSMGTVIPARKVQIAARVGGQIVSVSPQFIPGGRFRRNEQILRIEERDYELAVDQIKATLAEAEAGLKLEMGQQSVAQREYELLGETADDADEELLLRQPQLETRKAAVAAAEALLEKAQLDLERTTVVAPFNAVVQSRNVDVGAYIAPGTPLATLIGTDEYWVEASIPVDDLKWIGIPGVNETPASAVRIYHEPAWPSGVYRAGTVTRLMTELEPAGRMARLLVTVEDPLDLTADKESPHALILGSFVRVEIEGKEIQDVVKIPRTALRDGSHIWIVSSNNTLDVREVQVVWGGHDQVYISGDLPKGSLLITSDLAAPVPGMALRTTEHMSVLYDPHAGENKSAPAAERS